MELPTEELQAVSESHLRDLIEDMAMVIGLEHLDKKEQRMSKMYPECPLTNHNNYRDIDNPKLCALVRKDKKCLKEIHKNVKRKKPVSA